MTDAGTTLSPTWDELKMMGKEFFDALPSATEEEAQAGFKCLSLGYIGMRGTDSELLQAAMLIRIASRKLIEKSLATIFSVETACKGGY